MFEAVLLGIVQGVTEFFPVSSTAHLVLLPWMFRWSGLVDSLSFDVALHAGTLASLLICFRRDIAAMLRTRSRLLWLIALGTVPAGVAGLTLDEYVSGPLRSPEVIALMLVVFGVVMYLADRAGRRKRLEGVGVADALFIGVAQAMALVPGVSRSGVTIAAGLLRGVRREEAARFSFLLSMPAVLGATLLEGRKLLGGSGGTELALVAAGFCSALVTGVLAITFLLRYLKTHNLNLFVLYRFVLAGAILGWLWLGA